MWSRCRYKLESIKKYNNSVLFYVLITDREKCKREKRWWIWSEQNQGFYNSFHYILQIVYLEHGLYKISSQLELKQDEYRCRKPDFSDNPLSVIFIQFYSLPSSNSNELHLLFTWFNWNKIIGYTLFGIIDFKRAYHRVF